MPEGEERSIIELQSDEATYQASTSTAARVVWFARNVQPHPRLSALVERVQQPAPQRSVDVLANQTMEVLKTVVLDRLNTSEQTGGTRRGHTAPRCLSVVRSARPRHRGADPGFSVRPVARGPPSPVRGTIPRRFERSTTRRSRSARACCYSGARRKRAGCATCFAT